MDKLFNKFEALCRIRSLIVTYRQKTFNSQAEGQESMDAFLNRQLSDQDWLLWKRLQINTSEELATSEDNWPFQTVTGPQLKLLFNQYKRAGYERFICSQTKTNMDGY